MKFWSFSIERERIIKERVNKEAVAELGFSNDGRTLRIKRQKAAPLSAGVFNLVRQFLP